MARIDVLKRPGAAPSNTRERVIQLALVAVVLLVWELVGRRAGPFFLAPPSAVILGVIDLYPTAKFWNAVSESLITFAMGFSMAAFVGVVVGYMMGWYKPIALVLNPFLSAFYVVPIAALVPVMIIWFGIGYAPRVITIFLFSVFEIVISVYTGVKNVNQILIEVATSFGASRWQLFRRVGGC